MSDLVVVPRVWEKATTRSRRRVHGWTLHREDCLYIGRTKKALPAPDPEYAHTVPCVYCKPTGETRKIVRSRPKAPKVKYSKGEGHTTVYTEHGDGTWTATCTGCDISRTGDSRNAVRVALHRDHRQRDTGHRQ